MYLSAYTCNSGLNYKHAWRLGSVFEPKFVLLSQKSEWKRIIQRLYDTSLSCEFISSFGTEIHLFALRLRQPFPHNFHNIPTTLPPVP